MLIMTSRMRSGSNSLGVDPIQPSRPRPLPPAHRARRFEFRIDNQNEHPLGNQRTCGAIEDSANYTVEISPPESTIRHPVACRGMRAELVKSANPGVTKFRFHAPRILLVAYDQGSRRDGETFVEGLPPSGRRDIARKLTLVPAGYEYREWIEARSPLQFMFFHFDPIQLQIPEAVRTPSVSPRLFFEEPTIWATVAKLSRLLEKPTLENQVYLEALGLVLVHELSRLDRGIDRIRPQIRGGLAAWQQRVVTRYIQEHLAEQIPLTTLAELVRLSPYHFCRAFKQSFGLPPHRYHSSRRIELAKVLLKKRPLSVTQVGLTLGFSETSSFTGAFRKATGVTPSEFHRSVAL